MQTQATETIVITRTFNSPVAKVFKAWTDPNVIAKWFFPNERWLSAVAEVSLVPGGAYKVAMHHQDGDVFTNDGKVVEFEQDKKLAFTWKMDMGPEPGKESLVSVTFEPCPEGTKLTINHTKLPAGEEATNTNTGWEGCLTSLTNYLAKEQN